MHWITDIGFQISNKLLKSVVFFFSKCTGCGFQISNNSIVKFYQNSRGIKAGLGCWHEHLTWQVKVYNYMLVKMFTWALDLTKNFEVTWVVDYLNTSIKIWAHKNKIWYSKILSPWRLNKKNCPNKYKSAQTTTQISPKTLPKKT